MPIQRTVRLQCAGTNLMRWDANGSCQETTKSIIPSKPVMRTLHILPVGTQRSSAELPRSRPLLSATLAPSLVALHTRSGIPSRQLHRTLPQVPPTAYLPPQSPMAFLWPRSASAEDRPEFSQVGQTPWVRLRPAALAVVQLAPAVDNLPRQENMMVDLRW